MKFPLDPDRDGLALLQGLKGALGVVGLGRPVREYEFNPATS
jgi:hypothetical protein